jgi:hypothetical protein
MAATSTSSLVAFKTSDETTKAGRCLALLKSVKGKGASMSPRLKLVVDGIFGIVPEFKSGFRQPGPRQIDHRNLQILRQNSEQFDLLFTSNLSMAALISITVLMPKLYLPLTAKSTSSAADILLFWFIE